MGLSEISKKWQKLSKRVLLIGVAVGIAVCIAMFIVLGVYTNNKSKDTINDVGETFMTGIGSQMVMRYNQVIEQRTTMVEALHTTYRSSDADVNDKMKFAAEKRGFDYLAFMDGEGNLQMLLGDTVKPDEPAPFITSLKEDKVTKFAVATSYKADGTTAIDTGIVLIGVPTTADGDDDHDKPYKLENGGESVALVAGLKNPMLSDMLAETNTDGSAKKRFDTHIIRSNGAYVLHPNDNSEDHTQYANFFEQIRSGFGMDEDEAESLIQTLETRMSTHKVFSTVIHTSTPRKHMYCASLENSEWYLVTVMDYTDLDNKVTGLSKALTGVTVGICAGIMVILIAVFVIYLFLNRRNLQQVEHAREVAENANRAKSEFLSNMSHDIRTPMNAIVGMTAIALANEDDKRQVSDCLKKISLSSRHLLGLINDVLDMSKIESGKMTLNTEQTSLTEMIDSIATIMQPQIKIKNQKFDVNVHDVTAENVYCDRVRLNQVLLNLLSNAYKFTPDNGTIDLSLYQEESPLGNRYVRTHIEVQDTGIGMSEEFQKKIFDSFTREDSARVNKTEGTGLGMSITKYIVDSMHGTIEVDSKLGEGTKFHVTLDLEIAEGEEAESRKSEVSLEGKNILVAEDNDLNWEIAERLLTNAGLKVEHAENGQVCVDKLLEHKPDYYDAILMDIRMPVMNGLEAAAYIRGLRKGYNKVPIIAMTADAFSEDMQKCLDCGMNAHIAKPIDIEVVKATIAKFIEE